MLDTAPPESLDPLTPAGQKAILAFAEYLRNQRAEEANAQVGTEALLAEVPAGEPRFEPFGEGLSPARIAARRFMRENSTRLRLLAE